MVLFAGDVARAVARAVVRVVVFAAAFVVLAGAFFAVDRVEVLAVVFGAFVVLVFVVDFAGVVLLADFVVFAVVFGLVVFVAVDRVEADLVVDLAVVFGAVLVAVAFVVLVVVFGAVLLAVLLAVVALVERADVARAVVPVVLRVRLVVVRVEVGRVAAVLDEVEEVREVEAVLRLVVAFGSFLAPLTTSLNVVPARKAGTLVFFTRTVSPVRGFLAVRAARARFSNTPKPVMLTFSPLWTVRMMMSTRLSTACAATFLSPKRSESASMSWALLAIPVLQEELRVTRPHRPTCAHGITNAAQIPNGTRIFSLSCAPLRLHGPSGARFACRSA